jgi:hypothetical protein
MNYDTWLQDASVYEDGHCEDGYCNCYECRDTRSCQEADSYEDDML